MPSELIRVLIAEDSLTVRYHLAAIIDEMPQLMVIGMARDGEEAVNLVKELKPDVVSMDVRMPGMDGLEATRHIMRAHPTPVVIVSNLVEREIDLSFKALQAGALAVVPKPPSRNAPEFAAQRHQLVNTLQAMAGVRVVRRWASVYEVTQHEPKAYHTRRMRPTPELIAVAASAGGPSATATLLSGLGGGFKAPVVIVQHMPDEFIGGLARWLGKFTEAPVRMAADDEILQPGVVHLAPGGHHLRVQRHEGVFVARLDDKPGAYRYQPSADVLFESAAAACGERGVGIILTGMGDDGAAGLLAMRRAGARTFAQDESSSVVFGMPSAAIQRGAVERVMSPTQLAASLRKLL